jgi:hypothetical protein
MFIFGLRNSKLSGTSLDINANKSYTMLPGIYKVSLRFRGRQMPTQDSFEDRSVK